MLKKLSNAFRLWNNWVMVIFCLTVWQNIIKAQILYVGIKEKASVVESQLEIACNFYGVEVNRILLDEPYSNIEIDKNFALLNISAVIINANCPPAIVIKYIMPKIKKSIPILICGIKPQINNELLFNLSGGRISCNSINDQNEKGSYEFIGARKITSYLDGIKLNFDAINKYSLNYSVSKKIEPIIIYRNKENELNENIFVKLEEGIREIFFNVEMINTKLSPTSNLQFIQDDFIAFSSTLMFIKYSCGDRCWHMGGHFANLTIDDPWLTEPYGYFSYRDVLELSNKNRFHTTIAFIPWNFDRSEQNIVNFF